MKLKFRDIKRDMLRATQLESDNDGMYTQVYPNSRTARRLNQSILKEIGPIYSLEGFRLGSVHLKLKLQHFGYLMQRGDSLEKTLMLGKIEGRRRRG